MNMNCSYPTTMHESILAQMCVFLVLFTIFAFYHEKKFYQKYTMRQKLSFFFQSNFFMIKYATVFDMRFIGRVLHNFIFHDNSACFSYVLGLARDVEETVQFTCPAFHVHPMSSKFPLTDLYMYQNK